MDLAHGNKDGYTVILPPRQRDLPKDREAAPTRQIPAPTPSGWWCGTPVTPTTP